MEKSAFSRDTKNGGLKRFLQCCTFPPFFQPSATDESSTRGSDRPRSPRSDPELFSSSRRDCTAGGDCGFTFHPFTFLRLGLCCRRRRRRRPDVTRVFGCVAGLPETRLKKKKESFHFLQIVCLEKNILALFSHGQKRPKK